MTTFTPRPTLAPPPALPLPDPHPRPRDEQVFGTLLMEITVPDPASELTLSGWETRTWPVARLGDLTLEARPLWPHLQEHDLRAALNAQGYAVLGPVRPRRAGFRAR